MVVICWLHTFQNILFDVTWKILSVAVDLHIKCMWDPDFFIFFFFFFYKYCEFGININKIKI